MAKVKLDHTNNEIRSLNRWVRGNAGDMGITQKDIAEWLGLPQPSISLRLNNKADWTFREVVELGQLFGEPYTMKESI